jgi:tetratricopeptide (TPR) repeat protein
VREAALDGEGDRLLDEAQGLSGQEKWPEALAAVDRADKLLASAGRAERPRRLRELQKGLQMAHRLEEIYRVPRRILQVDSPVPSAGGTGGTPRSSDEEDFFWGREQDSRFAEEFREFGIDVDALEPAEAAARVGRADIRPALVKGLDEWAALRRRARGDNDPGWKKLVEIARDADPDAWRKRFREALLGRDRKTLERLADSVSVRAVPPATLCLLGTALQELGALDKAMSVLRQAQQQYPDDLWINNLLAWFSRSQFDPPRYEDALRHYLVVLALRPRWSRAHWLVAEVLQKLGARDEAIARLSRAVELDPQDQGARCAFGEALYEGGRLDDAIAEFREAVRLQTDDFGAHNDLGVALARQGLWDEAVAELREARRLNGDSPNVRHNLGSALRATGRLEEAIAELREAIRLKKDFLTAHYTLGVALGQIGRTDEAIAEGRVVLRQMPDHAAAHSLLGIALIDKGRLDEAIVEEREALRLNTDLPEAHEALGRALAIKGRLHEAIPEIRQAIRLKDHALYHFNLGLALGLEGEVDEAIREYHLALDRDPKLVIAHIKLGSAHEQLGRTDRAIEDYSRAIEIAPKDPRAWRMRGELFKKIGQAERAAADLTQANELSTPGK